MSLWVPKRVEGLVQTARSAAKTGLSILPPEMRQGPLYWLWTTRLARAQAGSSARERWRLRRLKSVVRHAAENTEGYRQLFKRAGVSWKDLRTEHDLRF